MVLKQMEAPVQTRESAMVTPRISVIGLGKLGSPLAAVLASAGYRVVGVDVDKQRTDAINAGRAPVEEPGLAALIADHAEKLSAVSDVAEAVRETDLTFIIVPTPSGADGAFSSRFVLECGRGIARGLADKDRYHLVVLTSTVMPGTTENELLPLLQRGAGKECGPDFGLCYNPEFIAIGDVVGGMLRPDFVLIGEEGPRAGDMLKELYEHVCENDPPIERMSFVNAEVAKIAVNTFVTMKISYANMLGEICERLPGGDADAVTRALGRDSRIGGKYLKSALGYGGPCFPRDTVAFSVMAERAGVEPTLAHAADTVNERQVTAIMRRIRSLMGPDGKVGILGLSYRPNTALVEESQSLEIAAVLAEEGVDVTVYDPEAMPAGRKLLGSQVSFAESAAACAQCVDLLVVATPWPEFENAAAWTVEGRPRVILDCWGIVTPPAEGGGPTIERVGRNSDDIGHQG